MVGCEDLCRALARVLPVTRDRVRVCKQEYGLPVLSRLLAYSILLILFVPAVVAPMVFSGLEGVVSGGSEIWE